MNALSDLFLKHVLRMERIPQPRYYPKPVQSDEDKAERLAAAAAKRTRRQERNWRNHVESIANNPTLHNKS